MSAGAITANIIWHAAKAMAGTDPLTSVTPPDNPTYASLPISP